MARPADLAASVFQGLWQALWPPRCPLCQEPISGSGHLGFCPYCQETIKPINDPVCQVCGRALSDNSAPPCGRCGYCAHDPPAFDLARGYGQYGGALREAILALKFRRNRSVVPAMARIMRETYNKRLAHAPLDAIVPVPLHKQRLRERGYNQSADLARPVARTSGLPLLHDALVRTRATEPQFGLTIKQRKNNTKGAFKVKSPGLIKGGSILLIDDILTTGTTANECARALKRAGAEKVAVLTLARSD